MDNILELEAILGFMSSKPQMLKVRWKDLDVQNQVGLVREIASIEEVSIKQSLLVGRDVGCLKRGWNIPRV